MTGVESIPRVITSTPRSKGFTCEVRVISPSGKMQTRLPFSSSVRALRSARSDSFEWVGIGMA